MAMKKDTESGKTYDTLKDLFNHVKRVYTQREPFLNGRGMGLVETSHIDTVRKANMATFIISILGSQDVGFYHLNEYFMDTFVAEGDVLSKAQADLFLELKTQAYISAISNGERSREEILEDLFPDATEDQFLERRHGNKQLAPSEKDFLMHLRKRRKRLLDEPYTQEGIKALPEKYVWSDFLRHVSRYVSKNYEVVSKGQVIIHFLRNWHTFTHTVV